MTIRITTAGRAYHQLRLPERIELAAGATTADALTALSAHAALPASCLLALGGKHLGTLANHPPAPLRDGDELLLLAPVAGG